MINMENWFTLIVYNFMVIMMYTRFVGEHIATKVYIKKVHFIILNHYYNVTILGRGIRLVC